MCDCEIMSAVRIQEIYVRFAFFFGAQGGYGGASTRNSPRQIITSWSFSYFKINEKILPPGEFFSYFRFLGPER